LRLAAKPVGPYSQWRDTALVFAGTGAWELARPIREAGRRAVTVLPHGESPSAIAWPRVRFWLGRCDDLEPGLVVGLARALIGAGAERVTLLGQNVPHRVLVARRRCTP
jgi:hypothetical protein